MRVRLLPAAQGDNMYNPINEELNSRHYRDTCCYLCGRKYPDTVLNIEGHIHHGEKYRCLDLKSCRRAQRKARHGK